MLDLANTVFKTIYKGLDVFDRLHKTKYATKYKRITEALANEEAKPIYDDDPDAEHNKGRRDQGKIDRLLMESKILLDKFLGDEGIKQNEEK